MSLTKLGNWENRVFVKLFVAARTSGPLKKISDRELKTLIALALYMDENGDCYPSQVQIAKDLGCSRVTVNHRIQSLLKFRFNGQPVVHALKVRNKEGKWDNIRYTILPVAQLKIFKKPSKKEIEPNHVSKTIHGPCNDIATWQNCYTNKNHILNKNHINNVNNAGEKIQKRTEKQEFLAQDLAEKLLLGSGIRCNGLGAGRRWHKDHAYKARGSGCPHVMSSS